MSIVDKAIENLEDHGVEVERPDTVQSHNKINSESELFSAFGVQESIEAASYNHLNDRIDVYKPLAISSAIKELDEDELDKVSEAFKSNQDKFRSQLRELKGHSGGKDFIENVKVSKLHYIAALKDEGVDNEIKEKLRDSMNQKILENSEHELVHASHYQEIFDEEVESLQDDFERYMKDVRGLNQELGDYGQRQVEEGISSLTELENAAALNFIDEDRLQTIVSLAGREHQKWENQYDKILEEHAEKKNEVKEEVKEELDLTAAMDFDMIASAANRKDHDVDEAVEKMEKDGVDEYETVIDAGVSKQQIKKTLRELEELNETLHEKTERSQKYRDQTEELLEEAIQREAELQGGFDEFLEPYVERMRKGTELPGEFTEAYAQFWTAYREGNLEDNREAIFAGLEGYDIEGLDETMDDLLNRYDELEGSEEERVAEIMSSQMEYLEENYDVET